MSAKTLGEIAQAFDGHVVGDAHAVVTGIEALERATASDLSFLSNARYLEAARRSDAGAILVREGEAIDGRNLVVVADPYFAFARLLEEFRPRPVLLSGIHPDATIAADAEIGEMVSVGARAVVGPGCRLGARAEVRAGAVLGARTVVGSDTIIHSNAVLYDETVVGSRCIIHAGAVLGSDGFGFAPHGGKHYKIPQRGRVVVEDDVEIGANSTIDRGTLGETRIGAGTKIDNLVQVAHNVTIGANCILVSQSGISGSTRLGDNVTMAGQSATVGHIEIGENSVLSGRAVATKSLPAGSRVSGFPAMPHREWLKASAAFLRLGTGTTRRERKKE